MNKSIAVAIVWGFYCLMYLLSVGKIRLRESKIFITLGALTYPLYLIHDKAGKVLIDRFSPALSEEIAIVLVILLMLFASWVIHAAIEKPLATPMKKYLLSMSYRIKPLAS